MNVIKEIEAYRPVNKQEECDKKQMLSLLGREDCLSRENLTAHVTVSVWTVNKERTKTLMVYHNLYDSWSWVGGHADGDSDLRKVALKELQEETGIKNAKLVSEDIFSLEILTVDGHEKRGRYVPSHLHLNLTFLAEAEEKEKLIIREEENKDVRWWKLEEALEVSSEKWMIERIYKKLIQNMEKYR